MNLNEYMNSGIRSIGASLSRYYLNNARGRRFALSFIASLQKSAALRRKHAANGLEVPPFLIASIASRCNLHCAGCYARSGGICSDEGVKNELSADEWSDIFTEAAELGVSFILLAGGEPLLKRQVLERAASFEDIAFPVFTNGTLLNESYLELFDAHRNLIPVLSLEGGAENTDRRRGEGVAASVSFAMDELHSREIMFAASITVTRENLGEVTGESFVSELRANGCGVFFYVEYVPIQDKSESLTLGKDDSRALLERIAVLKKEYPEISFLAFPGDEKHMDGCLAAGRGFFHINPAGGAEPCPFSPYSALNVREGGLHAAIASPFFARVREISRTDAGHSGGCTLFAHEAEVKALLSE